ncbi:MAG TPA: methylmalonyl-CoA epimerase [Terriglobales bacterium]|nr:methylmalonyl-CoA epimerase [Terriglobales bacterium]
MTAVWGGRRGLQVFAQWKRAISLAGEAAIPRMHKTQPMTFALDHLGIAVKSLTTAKGIYEKLGLSISPEETVAAEKVRVVMVPVGGTRLELLEPTSDDSVIAKFIARRGEGLHHICMRVPNLAAAIEKLKSDGVRLVSEDIKIGAGGHRYIFVHPSSTGGVLLELVDSTR